MLAKRLLKLHLDDPVVLALPRGGVPVAAEVARALHAPLDLVFVRKIGLPSLPEVAAAAVVDGGEPEIVVNEEIVERAGLSEAYMDAEIQAELDEINRRRRTYAAGRQRARLEGRVLVVVDDGIATGASVRAALAALRRKNPKRLILAVPVAPAEMIPALRNLVDQLICLETPADFNSVGWHYADFHQLSDAEVVQLLRTIDREKIDGVVAK